MILGISINGTDLGRSGIGVYVEEVIPRIISLLHTNGYRSLIFGTRVDFQAYQTAFAPVSGLFEAIILPSYCDRPIFGSFYHLWLLSMNAQKHKVTTFFFPAANRRLFYSSKLISVGVVHDVAQAFMSRKYGSLRDIYFSYFVLGASRKLNHIISVSNATQSDLKTLKINTSNTVIHNGHTLPIDIEQIDCNIKAQEYLIVSARLEHPGKNHLRLLKAYTNSTLKRNYKLVLTGQDWGALKLIQEEIDTLELNEHVRVCGYLPKAEYDSLFAHSTAVLCLGLREGFCLPALEAAMSNKPLVLSNTGAMLGFLGSAPFYCDPFSIESIESAFDQLEQLLQHTNEMRFDIDPEEFSWDYCANETVRVIQHASP